MKRTPTALSKEEDEHSRLAAIVEHSEDAIISTSLDGTILTWNYGAEKVYGTPAAEAIGRHISLVAPPERLREVDDLLDKIRRGTPVVLYETIRRRKDGTCVPVALTISPIKSHEGVVIGASTIARDITEQKKAEDAIRRAAAYHRRLLEASLDPLVTIDPEGKITDMNEATVRVTGYSREELIGTDFSRYFTDPVKAEEGYETAFRQGLVTDYELEIQHRNGQVTPVLYNASVYRDESGHVAGVFAAARDNTERRQTETLLRKFTSELERGIAVKTAELADVNTALTEEIARRKKTAEALTNMVSLLHATIESTADGILIIDSGGRVAGYNQNFVTMWNIPVEVLKNLDVMSQMDSLTGQLEDPDAFMALIQDLSMHPGRQSYDMLVLRDGRIFERYSNPQRIENAIVGRVWSYRDITERKRAEEKLIASLNEKEVLLREIHHRVKNNLQLISGLLDLTRMRTKDTKTLSVLTDMMMKIQTMAQIHTRLYESKQFDRINIGSHIRDQIASISQIYAHKGRDIMTEIETSELYLPIDQAIPCALAVNEILSNAYKHAFRGRAHGTLRVSAAQQDGRIRIIIQDDGVGMPKDLDIDRSRSLGLKLIINLVEHQLKGSLAINRKKGTEVIVEFPVLAQEG